MRAATRTNVHPADEPLAVTLTEIFDVLGELTSDEDEIVATMLYMVETRRVRLVTPPTAL